MNQLTPKGTYDIAFPTGDSSFASANFRNNFLSIYAGDLLSLRPIAHDIPDMSIAILGKDHNEFFDNIYHGTNNQRTPLTSGDSPTMSAPSSNPRIDTVFIDGSGDIFVQAGTEATSPTIPNVPSGDAIPICAIYHLATSERVVNYADKDSYSGDSYIYKDIRPLYTIPISSITGDIATLEAKKDENIINLAKTNFKVQAYHTSARYNLKDLYIDSFQDNTGIDTTMSSNYQHRGTPNYDVLASGGIATVVSIPTTGDSVPSEAMLIKEDTVGTGNLTYYISRHSGDYTEVTPNVMTDISAQPSGQVMRTKVVISGDSELENIGLAW